MAAKKGAAPTKAAPRRASAAQPAARRRVKKKPDVVEDALAAAAGYVAPDILPALPLVGPWLLLHPKVPPALIAAALAYVGGRIAGGSWRRSGRYAAMGAVGQYLLRRAAEKGAAETPDGLIGDRDQELLDARALFDALGPGQVEKTPAPTLRRLGDLVL